MKTVIHLKTARVYATNEDSTPKIERTTVKLEDGDNFLKFVKHMHLRGFIKSEPPFVDKVLRLKGKEYVEIDKKPWQDIVEKALADKKPMESKIDYKHLSEKQTKEISQLKANNDSFEERLKKLEGSPDDKSESRKALELKATELKIKFRDNIGDAKLLEKIKLIEPEYKA